MTVHPRKPFHDPFLPAVPKEPHTGKTDPPLPLYTALSEAVPALYDPAQALLPKAT